MKLPQKILVRQRHQLRHVIGFASPNQGKSRGSIGQQSQGAMLGKALVSHVAVRQLGFHLADQGVMAVLFGLLSEPIDFS